MGLVIRSSSTAILRLPLSCRQRKWELPAELLLELKRVVDVVDFEGTRDVVEKIHDQDVAIANSLTDLVDQYRFDRLQDLLEQS